MDTEPKFLLDGMLGKLARWLRVLGHDASYRADVQDDDLLAIAKQEDRILITRDKGLFRKAILKNVQTHLLTTVELSDSLLSLKEKYSVRLELETLKPRCSLCNEPLQKMSRSRAPALVPKALRERYSEFWRCSNCRKIYWQGSHWENMRELLEATKSGRLVQ